MYLLTKKFRFETAHRLSKGYKGKCANIHGHSWNGEITLQFNTLDEYDFGIDYAKIKTFTKSMEQEFDHGVMLHESDKDIIELCNKNGWKAIVFQHNPTSEVLAVEIYQRAAEWFGVYCVKRVIIEETCTSRCEYRGQRA